MSLTSWNVRIWSLFILTEGMLGSSFVVNLLNLIIKLCVLIFCLFLHMRVVHLDILSILKVLPTNIHFTVHHMLIFRKAGDIGIGKALKSTT